MPNPPKTAQVMNMIGAVKHVDKALEAGVDIICAQGGEGGGHTGGVSIKISGGLVEQWKNGPVLLFSLYRG